MSHYAKIEDNIVTQVIVAEESFFDSFVDTSPGIWLQTSYNTSAGIHNLDGVPLRGNFASPGMAYNVDLDVFTAQQPYPSWTLSEETFTWMCPVDLPADNSLENSYKWDEEIQNWILN